MGFTGMLLKERQANELFLSISEHPYNDYAELNS